MSIPTIEPLKIGIEAIEKARAKMHRWQETFDEMFEANTLRPVYFNDLEKAIIQILKEVYHDTDIIEWWIYKQDFGRRPYYGTITDENGEIIPMETLEDIYQYLVRSSFLQKNKTVKKIKKT